MNVVEAVGFAALVYKFLDMGRFLANAQWAAVKTQAVAWAAGIGGTFLWAQTQMASAVVVNGQPLDKLSGWSLVCVGLGVASAAGVGYTAKQAFDNNESAASPPLFKK